MTRAEGTRLNGVANSVDNFLDSRNELKLYEWRKMLEYPVDMFNSIIPLVLHLNIPSNNFLSHAFKYHKVFDIVDEKTQEMVSRCCACVYSKEKTLLYTHERKEASGVYHECVFMIGGGSGLKSVDFMDKHIIMGEYFPKNNVDMGEIVPKNIDDMVRHLQGNFAEYVSQEYEWAMVDHPEWFGEEERDEDTVEEGDIEMTEEEEPRLNAQPKALANNACGNAGASASGSA